jgi:lysine-specific demethylase 3
MDDMKLCEIHYLQGRHRQFKEKVPESLKLQRKPSKKALNKEAELEIRAQKVGTKKNLLSKPMKRKKSARFSTEAVDDALRKMKLKKGNLQLELIRMVLQRGLEKKKKETKKKTSDSASAAKKKKKKTGNDEMDMEEEENSEEEELTRQLPNGVMAISPAQSPSPRNFGNVGTNCHVKVGVDAGMVRRRCFRSKNIEPLPIGTMQVLTAVLCVLMLY